MLLHGRSQGKEVVGKAMERKSNCFQCLASMSMEIEDSELSFLSTGWNGFSFSQYLQLSCQRLHLRLWALSVHFPMSIRGLPAKGTLEFSFSASHHAAAHVNEP